MSKYLVWLANEDEGEACEVAEDTPGEAAELFVDDMVEDDTEDAWTGGIAVNVKLKGSDEEPAKYTVTAQVRFVARKP